MLHFVRMFVLKVNMKNLEWVNCLSKCYIIWHMKNMQWDECLCKCYTS
jgi:hypothetical protein